MKVVLRQAISGVGQTGQVVTVADAYARNYLIPKRLASLATPAMVAAQAREYAHTEAKQRSEDTATAAAQQRLVGVTIRLKAAASPQGTLFAAIKGMDILREIERQYSIRLHHITVRPDHLKTLGAHPVQLIWPKHPPVTVNIQVDHG